MLTNFAIRHAQVIDVQRVVGVRAERVRWLVVVGIEHQRVAQAGLERVRETARDAVGQSQIVRLAVRLEPEDGSPRRVGDCDSGRVPGRRIEHEVEIARARAIVLLPMRQVHLEAEHVRVLLLETDGTLPVDRELEVVRDDAGSLGHARCW